MGKVSRLRAHLRARITRRVLVESGGIFAAVVGCASGFASLMPQRAWTWTSSLFTLGGAALASVGYAIARSRPAHLPSDPLPGDSVSGCSISVVRDRNILRSVNELAEVVYPGVTPLDVSLYQEWLEVNPNILVALFDQRLRVQGYFDVFPLASSFVSELVAGTKDEQDIRTEHVLRPAAAAEARRLYLAGIAVRDAGTPSGNWRAAMLLWGLVRYFEHFYGFEKTREIVAVGATSYGEDLLERVGFTVATPGEIRKDGKPCYVRRLDRALADEVLMAVRDWTGTCPLSWTPSADTVKKRPRIHPLRPSARTARL